MRVVKLTFEGLNRKEEDAAGSNTTTITITTRDTESTVLGNGYNITKGKKKKKKNQK